MDAKQAWEEITQRLRDGLTGSIVLHCTQGKVMKYEINEVKRITVDKSGPLPVDLQT